RAGENRGTLSLRAKADSETGVRQVYLRGEAAGVVDYSTLFPVAASQIPCVRSTSLKRLVVTALAPGSGSAASEAVFNAKINGRGGFEGEVELKLEGLPPGVTLALTNIAAGENETAVRLVATDTAPTGTNVQLALSGAARDKDRIYRFQAPPVTLV